METWTIRAPICAAARATLPAPSPLTSSASSSLASAPSTSVHAAQLTTASGAVSATKRRVALEVGEVELGEVRADGVVAGAAGVVDHAVAEHAGGAGDEQLHRIPISELSPTMKR